MISSAFWRDRSVFVTGHTGFKGAWLALMLERLCAHTTGFGLAPTTTPSLYALTDAGAALCDVRGDVRDAALLNGALRAADPEIVIHMATRPPRSAEASAPARNAASSEGTRTLIDAVQAAPSVQATLVVSPDLRKTPRSRARGAADATRIVSVFCPDSIGGGDFARAESPSPLHVLDSLYGLLLLAERTCEEDGRSGGAWAFADPADVAALGWTPLLSPAEAAHWTAEWRRAFDAGADMRAITLEQIDSYLGHRVRLASPFREANDPLRRSAA